MVTTGSVREFALSAVVGTVGAFVALLLFEKPLLQIVAVKSMSEHAHLWGVKIPSESVDSHEDSSSTATYHAKQLTVLSLALCVVAIAGCAVKSELVVSLGESVLATPVLGIALLVGLLIYCMVMALRLDLKIALSALVGIVFSVVVVLGMSSLLNTTITDQLAGGLLLVLLGRSGVIGRLCVESTTILRQSEKATRKLVHQRFLFGEKWQIRSGSVVPL